MQSKIYFKNQRGVALILFMVIAGFILVAAILAIMMIGKSGNLYPLGSGSRNTELSTTSIQSVSDSDETDVIMKELESTKLDDLDKDLEDTSKELDSL